MSIVDNTETDYPIVKDLLIDAIWLLSELVNSPHRCDKEYISRYNDFRRRVEIYDGTLDE